MKSPTNITSEEWHIIEAYLDLEDFQLEDAMMHEDLNQIPDVTQKIEEVKRVREEIEDSIRQSRIKEFHKEAEAIGEDQDIPNIARRKPKSRVILFAAAMLILLFGIFKILDTRSSSDKIFADHFKPDIGLPLKMNISSSNEFYEGMVDYKQENYKEAIATWEVLLNKNPESDTLNYFLGVSNLALGNAPKSLEYLQDQERFQHSIFKEDAARYAALAKIKEGKFDEARVFLQNNPSPQNTKLLNIIKDK